MEIDFYWCEDGSEASSRDDSPQLGESAVRPGEGYRREVDIPPRRNPFGAPPRREREQTRGSPPIHRSARMQAAAQQRRASAAAAASSGGGGFFSALTSIFGSGSPSSGGNAASTHGHVGKQKQRPTPIRNMRGGGGGGGSAEGTRRRPSDPAVSLRETPTSLPGSPLGMRKQQRSRRSSGDVGGYESDGFVDVSLSSPGLASPGVQRSAVGGAGGAGPAVVVTPSLLSPSKVQMDRMAAHKATRLFRPENCAKLMSWVEPSLRTARLRRPEGKGMVLQSLGVEVLQQPCGDGIFLCAISRIVGDSPADVTQQLFAGDALVEVNGKFVAHLDLEKIIMIIATAGKNITLKVTTAKALSAALHTLLEQHMEAIRTSTSETSPAVYTGKFWDDVPESSIKRTPVLSPDGTAPASHALNVSGVSSVVPSDAEDDDNDNGNNNNNDLTTLTTKAMAAPLAVSSPARQACDGIHAAVDKTPTTATTGSGIEEGADTGRCDQTDTATTNANTTDSDATPKAKPQQEYGFYVKLPSERKGGRRRRMTLGSATSTSSSAPDTPKVPPDVYIDERRISRDIIGMRSSSSSIKSPMASRGASPSVVGAGALPTDVAPADRLPAGLLSPNDVIESPPTPTFSLAEHVRATTSQQSRVVAFLTASGLSKYVQLFEEEEIDYDTLMTLTEEDLEKMGIDKLGARRKLVRAIRQLGQGDSGSEMSFLSSSTGAHHAFSTHVARALSEVPAKGPSTPSDLSNYGSMDRPTPDMSEHDGEGGGAETAEAGEAAESPVATQAVALSPVQEAMRD